VIAVAEGTSKGETVAEGTTKQETVEVKKRRLRTALRQARTKAGLTQRAAADELVWSISKIVRIEQGTVPVTPTDVRGMLHLYGVTDNSRIEDLVNLAKQARDDKGLSAFSDVVSDEARELFGNESAARVIYKYEPSVFPGLFQTQEYARSLLHALGYSEEEVEKRLELREQRQRMLESSNHPELNFIVGETALLRPVGDNDVMREQIGHLLDLFKMDGISLSILPFAAGVHRAMGGAFTVLQFEDPLLPDLLYLENAVGERVSRDEEGEIKNYLELFVELQNMASKHGSLEAQIESILRERYGEYATNGDAHARVSARQELTGE
jgi:transcriptional regulator with XRE-family HTH domain